MKERAGTDGDATKTFIVHGIGAHYILRSVIKRRLPSPPKKLFAADTVPQGSRQPDANNSAVCCLRHACRQTMFLITADTRRYESL